MEDFVKTYSVVITAMSVMKLRTILYSSRETSPQVVSKVTVLVPALRVGEGESTHISHIN